MNEQTHAKVPGHRSGAGLTDADRLLMDNVDRAVTLGRELYDWWRDLHHRGAYRDKFPLLVTHGSRDESFGFIERSPVGSGGGIEVMGEVQNLFFDQIKPRSADLDWVRSQLREFALHYFLRVTAGHMPAVPGRPGNPAPGLGWADLCKQRGGGHKDIGFIPKVCKHHDGRFETFPERAHIMPDVRTLVDEYEWILAEARIFAFQLALQLSPRLPGMLLPSPDQVLMAVFTPFLVKDEPRVEDVGGRRRGRGEKLVAVFQSGFCILQNPLLDPFTFGPQWFEMGFTFFQFRLYRDCEIRCRVIFLSNRLTEVFPIPVNPVTWAFELADLATFGLAKPLLEPIRGRFNRLPGSLAVAKPVTFALDTLNLMTGNRAERDYCISSEEMTRFMLRKHASLFADMLHYTASVWNQVPDWTDKASLPDWIKEGMPL